MGPLRTLAAILVVFAGVSNGVAGFLALLPGLFEAEMARTASAEQTPADPDEGEAARGGEPAEEGPSVVDLARTRYGATALLFLAAALVQIVAGGQLPWLLGGLRLAVPAAAVVLGVAAELWGWHLKGEPSVFNAFGLAASALLAVVVLGAASRA